ncbi:MAG: response regulator transcription factor [Ignavibacteria bacterium]
MNKKLVNIAVLEPSQIIYEGLSNILLKSGYYFKLFKIDSLKEISTLIDKEKPDIIIVNPSQVQNKTKEFYTIKKKRTETCWIALVHSYYDSRVLEMYDDVINITDDPKSIIELILNLNSSNSSQPSTAEQEQLTEREIEVLKLMVEGLPNKEIADKLFISIHTVVSHRKNISQKTGIKSQSGLTIYAISNKIIQLEDYSF